MDQPAKAKYTAPTIKVMDEDEVLRTFQLTSAMSGWWIPAVSASA